MWTWNSDPSVVLGIGALSALYFLAAGRWRARLGGPPAPDRRRLWLFAAAMATLILALMSPIETLADTRSFMVHVFQHMLLTLVFPPLLIAATPPWMLRPLLRPARVMALARVLTRPLPAYLGFNVVFAVAHVPVVFNLVQASEARHAVEHLLFIATAVLMWWPILSPLPELPRLPYPGQLLYLFVQTLVGGVLIGALVTLSPRPVYDLYASGPGPWGWSPLVDQQAGGLLMWVGGGSYFLAALAVVFFRWAAADAREQRPSAPAHPATPAEGRAR